MLCNIKELKSEILKLFKKTNWKTHKMDDMLFTNFIQTNLYYLKVICIKSKLSLLDVIQSFAGKFFFI